MNHTEVASAIETVRNRTRSRDGTPAGIHNLLADTANLVAWLAQRELARATEPAPKVPYRAPSLVEKERLAALAGAAGHTGA